MRGVNYSGSVETLKTALAAFFGFKAYVMLPLVIFVLALIVLATRGNVFRAVLASVPIVIGYLLIATSLAPLFTRLAAQVGSATSYAGPVTAFTDGGNPLRFWFFHLFQGNWIALVLLAPASALLWLAWRRYRRWQREAQQRAAQEPQRAPEPPPQA